MRAASAWRRILRLVRERQMGFEARTSNLGLERLSTRGLASAFVAGEWPRNEPLFRASDALRTGAGGSFALGLEVRQDSALSRLRQGSLRNATARLARTLSG
jgi:hypothetical protein